MFECALAGGGRRGGKVIWISGLIFPGTNNGVGLDLAGSVTTKIHSISGAGKIAAGARG